MSRSEIDAAWDSAEYNAKRAEKAEARVAELEREMIDTTWQDHADHWQKRAVQAEARVAENEALRARVAELEGGISGETSDGYHTFNELYEFRMLYNAALFNEWAGRGLFDVHKSWRHHDGEPCFGGGWFIVSALLPSGQISNHYPAKDWALFNVPNEECALFPYDGHTSKDVAARIRAALEGKG